MSGGDINVQEALARLKLLEAQIGGTSGATGKDGFADAAVSEQPEIGAPLGVMVNVTVVQDGREYPLYVTFGPEWCKRPKELIRYLTNKRWNLRSYPVREEAAPDGFARRENQPNNYPRR